MSEASLTKRSAIPALTSLRFFAAFYVVVFHGAGSYVSSAIARSFVGTGYIAVDLFFVLSGFVLAYKYCGEDGTLIGSRRAFWAARFARVYPVYVLSLAIGAPLYLQTLHQHHTVPSMAIKASRSLAVVALLLTQAWFFRLATAWNTPAWSFGGSGPSYLAFPVVLSCTRGPGKSLVDRPGRTSFVGLRDDSPDPIPGVPPGRDFLGSRRRWRRLARYRNVHAAPTHSVVHAWCHRRVVAPSAQRWRADPPVVACGSQHTHRGFGLCAGAWLPYLMLHSGLMAPAFALLISLSRRIAWCVRERTRSPSAGGARRR